MQSRWKRIGRWFARHAVGSSIVSFLVAVAAVIAIINGIPAVFDTDLPWLGNKVNLPLVTATVWQLAWVIPLAIAFVLLLAILRNSRTADRPRGVRMEAHGHAGPPRPSVQEGPTLVARNTEYVTPNAPPVATLASSEPTDEEVEARAEFIHAQVQDLSENIFGSPNIYAGMRQARLAARDQLRQEAVDAMRAINSHVKFGVALSERIGTLAPQKPPEATWQSHEREAELWLEQTRTLLDDNCPALSVDFRKAMATDVDVQWQTVSDHRNVYSVGRGERERELIRRAVDLLDRCVRRLDRPHG